MDSRPSGWLFGFVMSVALGAMACAYANERAALDGAAAQYPGALESLVREADGALLAGPFSVMDKKSVAPGGDKHDYFCLSPYHWPNPDTVDGKPYVYRDGKTNPEGNGPEYDREAYNKMASCVETLVLAYRYTRKACYGEHAVRLLRVWFLDPATRMNPNLEYAQCVPGLERGPSWGIIHGIRIVRLAEAADWLDGVPPWTDQDRAAWQAWLADYLRWLRKSKKGREESRAVNNHGTWYDVQVAALALRCGERSVARKVLGRVGKIRIARQIQPDGRQPLELVRTKSWDYSVLNLEGLFELASLGEQRGVDLWRFETNDGRGIRRALDYLVPYATGDRKWPHKQIGDWKPERLYPLLRRAAIKYREDRYMDIAQTLSNVDTVAGLDHLRYPTIR